MRLEQLVLYGPGDDDRVRFGPRLTVFAGLKAPDRTELIETIVDALTGRLSNASVVYTDHDDRRIYADRTGASFADTGVAAPSPADLLGRDPAAVANLITLTAADLGRGEQVSAQDLRDQLVGARGALEQLHAEHVSLLERANQIHDWRTELTGLDRRIESADDDAARWAWVELRRRLDEVRAELAMIDRADEGTTDTQILEAVDAIRAAGETWTDLAAASSELAAELGPLPAVSPEDLARVASTPDELPPTFLARMDGWRAATDAARAAEAERLDAEADPADHPDPLVNAFAALDQDRLWEAHRTLLQASEAYAAVSAAIETDDEATDESEHLVEEAHLVVLRAQRKADQLFLPGVLGAATLAVGALLAGLKISLLLGVLMLVASVAMAWWLLVLPRRELAAANEAEREALSNTDAGSWLGMHLRRLDHVTDSRDRRRFETVANNRATAMVDWEEVVGLLSPEDLSARADEVRAQAALADPRNLAQRRERARSQAEATAAAERLARASLRTGLEAYGLSTQGGADLDPEQLLAVLTRRIEAGRLARRATKLATLCEREAEAARHLDQLLGGLDFTEGDLESRLERAIQAVTTARQRQALTSGARSRADVEADFARLEAEVTTMQRPGWADSPDPAGPPTDPDVLEARRREVSELVAAGGEPDVVGAERRYQVGLARVRDLEARMEELAAGPRSLATRLTKRLTRTTWIGGAEETVPVLVDDVLTGLPTTEQMDLLDLLVHLSEGTQIVYLSDDPVIRGWARDRVGHLPVTLFELEGNDRPVHGPVPVS